MDENNTMHFSCEPMGDYSPSNGQGAPSGDPKKPEKKGKITGKIVAMLLVVALLGSVGGSALTAAINSIHSDDKEAVQAIEYGVNIPTEHQSEVLQAMITQMGGAS